MKKTLLFIGDSITDAGRERPIGEGAGLGSGYVSLIQAMLALKGDDTRVLNTGISGDTVRHLDKRWDADCVDLKPDALVIKIGVNDVWRKYDTPDDPSAAVPLDEYVATYKKLLDRAKAATHSIYLLTPYFAETDASDPMRIDVCAFADAVVAIAKEYGLPCINLQTVVDGAIAVGVPPTAIAADRVHPDAAGCYLIADAFLSVYNA